jgi:hypothetical protein
MEEKHLVNVRKQTNKQQIIITKLPEHCNETGKNILISSFGTISTRRTGVWVRRRSLYQKKERTILCGQRMKQFQLGGFLTTQRNIIKQRK